MKKNKKLISFVVPCYNSESYMERCINTLLKGKEDVEIIIVNDGSIDKTKKIAEGYKKRYPKIIKTIHKINGGHGSAVNAGLKKATGLYFKVVDSDDWLDEEALIKLITKIKKLESENKEIDLFVCNYVYDHLYDGFKKTMNYRNIFHEEQITNFEETASFKNSQYLIMHALIYRTDILKECKLVLPEHTFYVDNLVAILPLKYVKTIYYMDLDFYRYFIGREDQSVQEPQLIKRSSHQVLVTKLVCNKYDLDEVKSKKLRKMMYRECVFCMTIGTIFSRLAMSEEGEKQYKELWKSIKENNPKLYKRLIFSKAGACALPGKFGRFIAIKGYRFAHSLVKFN